MSENIVDGTDLPDPLSDSSIVNLLVPENVLENIVSLNVPSVNVSVEDIEHHIGVEQLIPENILANMVQESDSDSDSDRDNDVNDENDFYDEEFNDSETDDDGSQPRSDFVKGIAKWVEKSTISRDNCNDLLVFLHNHGHADLPKTYATLMQTPREKIILKTVSPGKYYHYGIQNHFSNDRNDRYEFLKNSSELEIDIGIDGLKVFKSSKIVLWPIIGAFVDKPNVRPFLIGCYCGKAGPTYPDDFLRDFCEEMESLNSQGGVVVKHNPNRLPIKIRCFSADAPARAFLAGIKYHNATHGCPKCDQVGQLSPKSTTVGNPRTDETFSNRDHPVHHNIFETMLLEKFGIRMVSQFPLDVMHLVDIGVTRKILQAFVAKIVDNVRIENISSLLISIKTGIPSEFNRHCRSIDHLSLWKATECRQFLLYTGMVVLKDNVDDNTYYHFLLLMSAIRLLVAPTNVKENASTARILLTEFVKHFPAIYGNDKLTYNVHVHGTRY